MAPLAPWGNFYVIVGSSGTALIGIHRARRQTTYAPVWQDWLWYAIVPCSLYAALAMAALFLRTTIQLAMFVVAGAALGLLLGHARPKLLRTYMPTLPLNDARDALQKWGDDLDLILRSGRKPVAAQALE